MTATQAKDMITKLEKDMARLTRENNQLCSLIVANLPNG